MIFRREKKTQPSRRRELVSISRKFDTFIGRIDVLVLSERFSHAANPSLLSVYLQEAELVSFVPRCESPARAVDADKRRNRTV